jgi:hypothetical protein
MLSVKIGSKLRILPPALQNLSGAAGVASACADTACLACSASSTHAALSASINEHFGTDIASLILPVATPQVLLRWTPPLQRRSRPAGSRRAQTLQVKVSSLSG